MTRTCAKGVDEAAKCEFDTFIDRDDILIINSLQTFDNDFSENTDIVMSRMDIINEEELIDRLFNAIPTEKQHLYKTFFLERRLWAWERRYKNQISRPECSNSSFHKQLISDINSTKYPLGTFRKLLLTKTNPIIRFFVIISRKAISIIYRTANTRLI